ncbi:SH3 domain-containing protein [Marivita sp. S6314]|uniref:SH3 domain-containing protein n=1 Tax=Marivita sp. S6314 TaxID=2926406 RepID=UPI001FF60E1C|nr:SH3 domain-containing protein [Marivita sp. S6314]MCK0148627.1 SH3 domain-containing protein [Marivita sp. S6314]
MGIRATLIAACCATPVLAEPSYHRVVGVAAGDTLNIRTAPSASGDDIGDLAFDATAIEVTGFNDAGTWARISTGEQDGWVSTRFLQPDTVPTFPQTSVPHSLICSGTEPFWALGLYGRDARYSHPTDGDIDFTFDSANVAEGRLGSPALITVANDRNQVIEATITGASCSDGMSDRTYGWSVTLQMIGPGQRRFLDGCCSLPRD